MRDPVGGEAVESAGRTVFRHSVMTFGTRIGIVLVNIPTSILIARLLGVDGQGAYASATIFPALFAMIGLLSIDAAHTYLLSKGLHPVAEINGQSALLMLVLSAILVPAYLVFVALYPGVETPELRSVLTLAALVVPVLLAKYLSVALLLGLQRIRWFNAANMIQAVVLLGLMCVNLFVARGGPRGAVVAYLVSELSVTLVAFAMARREVAGKRLFRRPPPGLFRRSVVYGLQGHIGNVLTQFTYRFDMFLVLSIVGIAGQGFYSISVLLAEKLSHIPQSVQVVFFPKASSLETEEVNRLTPRVVRNSLFLTAVAGLVLYLFSRPLLTLFYGTAFLPALRAFRYLIPGIVMLSIAKILASDFSSRDRRIYYTIATAVALAVNVILCVFWIPRMGIEGAALASTVAYSLQSVIMLVVFGRLSGRGVLETTIVRGEDFSRYVAIVRGLLGRRRSP